VRREGAGERKEKRVKGGQRGKRASAKGKRERRQWPRKEQTVVRSERDF
jgi:hypothetical protein